MEFCFESLAREHVPICTTRRPTSFSLIGRYCVDVLRRGWQMPAGFARTFPWTRQPTTGAVRNNAALILKAPTCSFARSQGGGCVARHPPQHAAFRARSILRTYSVLYLHVQSRPYSVHTEQTGRHTAIRRERSLPRRHDYSLPEHPGVTPYFCVCIVFASPVLPWPRPRRLRYTNVCTRCLAADPPMQSAIHPMLPEPRPPPLSLLHLSSPCRSQPDTKGRGGDDGGDGGDHDGNHDGGGHDVWS